MTAKYVSIRQKIGEKCIFLNAPIIPVPTGQKNNVLLPALRDAVFRIPVCPQDLCLSSVLRGMCQDAGEKKAPISQRRRHWGGPAGSFVMLPAAASELLPHLCVSAAYLEKHCTALPAVTQGYLHSSHLA